MEKGHSARLSSLSGLGLLCADAIVKEGLRCADGG